MQSSKEAKKLKIIKLRVLSLITSQEAIEKCTIVEHQNHLAFWLHQYYLGDCMTSTYVNIN